MRPVSFACILGLFCLYSRSLVTLVRTSVPKRELPKGGLGTVYCFLEGLPLGEPTSWYRALGDWYQSALFYLVFGTVVQQSMETLPAWYLVC
jgi:hypothetical protein